MRTIVPLACALLGACIIQTSSATESQPAEFVGRWALVHADKTVGDTETWHPEGSIIGSTGHPYRAMPLGRSGRIATTRGPSVYAAAGKQTAIHFSSVRIPSFGARIVRPTCSIALTRAALKDYDGLRCCRG